MTRWQRRLARALPGNIAVRVPPGALPIEYLMSPGRVRMLLGDRRGIRLARRARVHLIAEAISATGAA